MRSSSQKVDGPNTKGECTVCDTWSTLPLSDGCMCVLGTLNGHISPTTASGSLRFCVAVGHMRIKCRLPGRGAHGLPFIFSLRSRSALSTSLARPRFARLARFVLRARGRSGKKTTRLNMCTFSCLVHTWCIFYCGTPSRRHARMPIGPGKLKATVDCLRHTSLLLLLGAQSYGFAITCQHTQSSRLVDQVSQTVHLQKKS